MVQSKKRSKSNDKSNKSLARPRARPQARPHSYPESRSRIRVSLRKRRRVIHMRHSVTYRVFLNDLYIPKDLWFETNDWTPSELPQSRANTSHILNHWIRYIYDTASAHSQRGHWYRQKRNRKLVFQFALLVDIFKDSGHIVNDWYLYGLEMNYFSYTRFIYPFTEATYRMIHKALSRNSIAGIRIRLIDLRTYI